MPQYTSRRRDYFPVGWISSLWLSDMLSPFSSSEELCIVTFPCAFKTNSLRAQSKNMERRRNMPSHQITIALSPVTKKTHEAAGFSLCFPSALLVITGSSAEPKWVKNRKTRCFLGYCLEVNTFADSKTHSGAC